MKGTENLPAIILPEKTKAPLKAYPLGLDMGHSVTLYQGSMLDMLSVIEPESVDAIVTDGPYGLGFMGKAWDKTGICFQVETWQKCLAVLKPGGHLLAFGSPRTFHRMACAIEDAGFEIRDCIMWLYGSGFPKSCNIGLAVDKKNGVDNRTGKIIQRYRGTNAHALQNTLNCKYEDRQCQNEWNGWGSCLKPAFEPIILARKPFCGSLVNNVIEFGIGGLNIDECRVPLGDGGSAQGRFPANIIHDGSEEVCAGFPVTSPARPRSGDGSRLDTRNVGWGFRRQMPSHLKDNGGTAARYFYCAKASSRDRDEGLEAFEKKTSGELTCRREGSAGITAYAGASSPKQNFHPTVKPTALMQYLIRLVAPKGAVILDPFMGSGSTGKAAMFENIDRDAEYRFIGIEVTEEYLPIAAARIAYAISCGDGSE